MSAKGRGPAKGGPAEFYPTPPSCTRSILGRLDLPGGRWLEPSAGNGAIIRAVSTVRADVSWTAIELRESCRRDLEATGADVITGDFFEWAASTTEHFAVAVLNPPFSHAIEFADRCLALADWVVVLERVNWVGTLGREAWMRAHAPDVHVLPERPFNDSCEFAWFAWPPGEHDRSIGRMEVLSSNAGQADLFASGAADRSRRRAG